MIKKAENFLDALDKSLGLVGPKDFEYCITCHGRDYLSRLICMLMDAGISPLDFSRALAEAYPRTWQESEGGYGSFLFYIWDECIYRHQVVKALNHLSE